MQPFVLTTEDIGKYDIQYIGKEKADEIPCYHVLREAKEDGEGRALFRGQDLGGRPRYADREDLRQRRGPGRTRRPISFPQFETYRQQIDGKYWFPVYTHADDVLHFQNMSQRIRMVVKYQDYKRFGAETTVTFGDEVSDPKTDPKKK